MDPLRRRILDWTDRLIAGLVCLVLLGSALAFGGIVWWWRPVAAVLATLLLCLGLLRVALEGRLDVWKSPLPILGGLLILLGLTQLVPLPSSITGRLSPESRSLHATGVSASRVHVDDAEAELPPSLGSRSPMTVDRGATLRWIFDAAVILLVFVTAARFADRLSRLAMVWGCILAAFAINAGFGFVELAGDVRGLYGFVQPGQAPSWAPSSLAVLRAPGTSELRALPSNDAAPSPWVVIEPDVLPGLGTLPGGGGALLAMGALALPLALSLALHLLAPRGSRDRVWARLTGTYQLGLLGLLLFILVLGSTLVGAIGGPWLAVPFAVGLVLAGIPPMRSTGLRWSAFGLTALSLGLLGAGVVVHGELRADRIAGPWDQEADWSSIQNVWKDCLSIGKDFPLVGTGLGTFTTIYPSYKSVEAASATARSSLLQFSVESGLAGLVLAGLAGLWAVVRLIPAWLRIGTADRALACGLIGTMICFGAFAAMHWSLELPAVAIAAAAWAGTLDRWLAGGTDLFVEPSW